MDNYEYWTKIALIHDVTCPVCGCKASFQQTGITSFKSIYCGHKEMEELVEERERLFFPPPPRPSYRMPANPKRKR